MKNLLIFHGKTLPQISLPEATTIIILFGGVPWQEAFTIIFFGSKVQNDLTELEII